MSQEVRLKVKGQGGRGNISMKQMVGKQEESMAAWREGLAGEEVVFPETAGPDEAKT